MQNPRRFSGGEVKLPLSEWREAVIRGVAGNTPVDVYLMLYDKLNIVVLSVDNGKMVRREEPTREYGDPRYDDPFYDPLEMMFRGWLNTGNVIDVGDGGTFLDYEVRYGVVCDVGVLWLKDGKESDVIDVLTESMKSSSSSNEVEEEVPDSREGSYSYTDLIPDRPKRDIAVGWTHQLAELMLQIPDGMKRAIVRGMGSDGKPFYFYTVPMIDEIAYRSGEYIDVRRNSYSDANTQTNNGEVKNIIFAVYSDVIGFIRFPTDIVNSSQEGRLTPVNFNEIVEMLVPEIINNPEKWITYI
ncbi:MAG: hypothetical protein M0Z77_03900 [Thermoplasmatales archaeon]|nr:hypothetical protein [Thermoplasmatales archaeon]